MSEGDIWFDTDDGFKIYTYQKGAWTLTRDSGIAQAINSASSAQTTANSKKRVFTTTPTVRSEERRVGKEC